MTSRGALVRHPRRDRRGDRRPRSRPWCSSPWSIAVLAGLFSEPLRGPGRLRGAARRCSCSGCCSSRWACGCSAASSRATRKPRADWPVMDFRLAGRPTHGAHRRGAHRRQPRHPPARRLRRPALDGIARLLRPGVPHARCTPQFTAWRAGPHARVACADCHIGEGARGVRGTRSSPACDSSCRSITNRIPRPIPPGAEMRAGRTGQDLPALSPADTRRRRS